MIDAIAYFVLNTADNISVFMERGGFVLNWIAILLLLLWMMIFERIRYFSLNHAKGMDVLVEEWEQQSIKTTWYSKRIREELLARGEKLIRGNFLLIETLVVICPLLGLLGTVTGMMDVFHIMAVTGGGDVKAMAGGVSRSTLPTLAGMVSAISGVIATTALKGKMTKEVAKLEDNLQT